MTPSVTARHDLVTGPHCCSHVLSGGTGCDPANGRGIFEDFSAESDFSSMTNPAPERAPSDVRMRGFLKRSTVEAAVQWIDSILPDRVDWTSRTVSLLDGRKPRPGPRHHQPDQRPGLCPLDDGRLRTAGRRDLGGDVLQPAAAADRRRRACRARPSPEPSARARPCGS